MEREFFYDSCGAGKIRARLWAPEAPVRAVVQLVHGIAEHVDRYDAFASYLNGYGIAVVAEDHMGHGGSVNDIESTGYFHGGWFAAVEDTYVLTGLAKKEFPDVPVILFGHSMGSFMVRTILAKYPESSIAGCVICGTGWQPQAVLSTGLQMSRLFCKISGERKPSKTLNDIIFGSYNKKVEHPRTAYDWLSRDRNVVDAYIADPMCGFIASAGLLRDMLIGITYIQNRQNLQRMDKDTPILFVAGGDDPVGAYGKGVEKAAGVFAEVGMKNLTQRIFPLCRHEILNEINADEIFLYIRQWIEGILL